MNTSTKLPACPPWCLLGAGADLPHLRNIDLIDGGRFSRVSLEVNLIHEGDGETHVRLGFMDSEAHTISDDPTDAESFHRIDVATAAAIGFAIVYLDPRGLHEFGLLLTDAATIARGVA